MDDVSCLPISLICFYILGRHRAYWFGGTSWGQRGNGRFLKCFLSEVEQLTSCYLISFLSQLKL